MDLVVDLLWLAMGVVGSCEIALRSTMTHHISRLNSVVGKAIKRFFSARVSDHWKALAARRYAIDALLSTLFIFCVLIAALVPVSAAFWLVSGSLDAIPALALRPDSAVFFTVVAVGYLHLRTWMRTRG